VFKPLIEALRIARDFHLLIGYAAFMPNCKSGRRI
jgi:hypothetical protein